MALTPRQMLDQLADISGEELLLADGYDAAIIGTARRCGQPPVVVYDRAKAVQCLIDGGMTREDAEEYFSFNTEGAWVGDKTPIFLETLNPEDFEDDEPRTEVSPASVFQMMLGMDPTYPLIKKV